jgi:hypothetical protein
VERFVKRKTAVVAPAKVLLERKTMLEGYVALFMQLCKEVGIESWMVGGMSIAEETATCLQRHL